MEMSTLLRHSGPNSLAQLTALCREFDLGQLFAVVRMPARLGEGVRVRQGQSAVLLGHWLALSLVRVEDAIAGRPSQHVRQLPGKVVDVLNTAVHPECTV